MVATSLSKVEFALEVGNAERSLGLAEIKIECSYPTLSVRSGCDGSLAFRIAFFCDGHEDYNCC